MFIDRFTCTGDRKDINNSGILLTNHAKLFQKTTDLKYKALKELVRNILYTTLLKYITRR